MNIVLLQPEIPPNTGNIARLCAATHSRLHLIEPLGFKLDDRQLQRAGMDYWKHVEWKVWKSWTDLNREAVGDAPVWFIESGGAQRYSDVRYGPDDFLVFGRETAGLPTALLESAPDRWLHIPMANPNARSLNLSNCVALVLFEALRQNGFPADAPAR